MDKNLIDTQEYPQYDPDYHNWEAFEKLVESDAIAGDIDDWWTWWVCWCSGYNAAMNKR